MRPEPWQPGQSLGTCSGHGTAGSCGAKGTKHHGSCCLGWVGRPSPAQAISGSIELLDACFYELLELL